MNGTSRRRALRAGIAVLALVLALAGAIAGYAWYRGGFNGSGTGATELPGGLSLEVAQLEALQRVPAFALTSAAGPYTLTDLNGHWSFVFFGYTNCPNACPATLGILNHVQETLRTQGVEPPRIVFVSLDPQRDTPPVLQRYVAAFGPDTIGVTGDGQALQGLLGFFGVSFERKPGPDATSYTLDHTTNFFLVRPDGRWLATFAPADDGDAVLADTQTLLHLQD
jgi:protein SCO1/2